MLGGKKPVNKEERNPKLVNRLISCRCPKPKTPHSWMFSCHQKFQCLNLSTTLTGMIFLLEISHRLSHTPSEKSTWIPPAASPAIEGCLKKEQRLTRCTPSNLTPAQSKPFSNFVKTKPWSSKVPTKVLALW